MKKALLLVFLIPSISFCQQVEWFSNHNGWNSSGKIRAMDTDLEGNIFSIGEASVGNLRAYISKYDKDGYLKWEYDLFTKFNNGVRGRSIKTDSEGNILASFVFKDTIFFRNHFFVNENPASLVLKLNTNGDLLWEIIINGSIIDYIITDSGKNIYLNGSISNSVTIFDTTLYSQKNGKSYFLKLNSEGEFQWVKQELLVAFPTLKDNYFSYFAVFDDTLTLNNRIFFIDEWLERGFLLVGADKDYNINWANQLTSEPKTMFSIMGSCRDNVGNIFIIGHHKHNIYYEEDTLLLHSSAPLKQEVYLAKFDTLGNLIWSKAGKSPRIIYSEGVSTDTSGNVFITGYFIEEMSIDNYTIRTSNYERAMYVAKFNKDGKLIWLIQAEGGASEGTAMTSDNAGNVFVGGKFGGDVNFEGHTLSGEGMFVAKIAWDAMLPNVIQPVKKEEGSLFIYPNPSFNFLNLQFKPAKAVENAALHIYNASGALVHSYSFSANEEFYKTVDVSNFSTGIYFLNIMCGEERRSRKFAISR